MSRSNIVFCITFLLFFFIITTGEAQAAETVGTDIVSKILSKFVEQTDKWYKIVQNYALNLFYWVLILEICYIGIKAVISIADLKELLQNFVMSVLTACLFFAIITNYQEWSNNIIFGLQGVAKEMAGEQASSDNPFKVGVELVKTINAKIDSFSLGYIIASYIACFIILICFSLISAKILITKCEVLLATIPALLLIPFGASSLFRDYAVNALRFILAAAFKLFTMQLIIGVGFSFIAEIKASEMNFDGIIVSISFSVILLAISSTIPDIVSSIINGPGFMGGASFRGATSAVGSVIGGAIGAAGGAAAASSALKGAHAIAQAQGASGFTQTAGSMAKSLWEARGSAKANNSPSSIKSVITEQVASLNLNKK